MGVFSHPASIKRIFVRDLTDQSKGNAIGIGLIPSRMSKVVRIKNTVQLEIVGISEAFMELLHQRNDVEVLGGLQPLVFDSYDNLLPL
jgi:hypothetical protein